MLQTLLLFCDGIQPSREEGARTFGKIKHVWCLIHDQLGHTCYMSHMCYTHILYMYSYTCILHVLLHMYTCITCMIHVIQIF